MANSTIKKLVTAGILIILFIIAVQILKSLIKLVFAVVLPAAILLIAGYIVYKVFFKGR